ncbi:DUF1631 domain-containing protein [Saccharophagus sp. K07]|uniref:DUF1631 domain-containing protein n=1 Tax=Saccharophagus sp. K07 TaxID=2283636 RepID=UPI00165290D3
MTDSAKVIRLEPEIQRQIRARLARLPAVIHSLNEQGQKFLASALETYFDAADDALFDLADKARSNHEQNVFFDSMREVRVQRRSCERRFFEMIDEAFSRLAGEEGKALAKSDAELSAEALSLVQNEDLEQLVALESTVARAMREHVQVLQAIAEALSRILPTPINEQKVPLSPAVICNAVMAQIKRLDIDIKAKLILFKLFDRLVVSRQPEINQLMIDCLEAGGIKVVMGRRYASEAEESESFDASGGAPFTSSSSASMPDLPPNRAELLNLLSFIQRLPVTADSDSGLDFERILASVQHRRGQNVEIGRLEKETMGLVQMLFRSILQDQALAPPFRDLIGRMQVPVLKMALLDEQFLMEKRHPARRLLNELVSVASEWQSSDADISNDPLLRFMRSIVDRVLSQFDHNPELFKDALADFTSFVEKEKRRAAVLEKRTVDAEDGKARAELARKTVASEIDKITAGHTLPEIVQGLIKGPWSNVLFVHGLKYGFSSMEWDEQIKVLADLVWSVQPHTTKAERQKLIRLIPDLILRLRRGLDSISYNPFEVAELLTGLEEIHLARIRGELAPSEQQAPAAKEVETRQAVAPEPEKKVEPEEPGLPADDPHMVMVASFAQGAWFDLDGGEGNEALRCRLAAFIRPTGRYIFVNRNGMKVAEKTQTELALALKSGHMRPLDHSMLFDKALESVVTNLRQAKAKNTLDLNNN